MKNLVCFLVFMLGLQVAYGQLEWVHNSRNASMVTDLERTWKDLPAVVLNRILQDNVHFGWGGPRLVLFDEMGEVSLDFENFPPQFDGGFWEFYDLITSPDSTMQLTGHGLIADTDPNYAIEVTPVVFFDKFDQAVEWCNGPGYNAVGAAFSSGSSIYYFRGYPGVKKLRWEDGCEWDSFSPNTFHLLDVAATAQDTLVWACQEGLVKMDTTGSVSSLSAHLLFEKLATTDWGGILGLENDSLHLLSTGLDILASAGFAGEKVVDFDIRKNKVAVLTDAPHSYIFSDSLVLESDFALPPISEYAFIVLGEDRVSVSGQAIYGTGMPDGGSKAPFVKEFSLTGNDFDLSNDVGVVEVMTGNAYTAQVGNKWDVFCDTVFVAVKNHGSNPVDVLYLSKTHQSQFPQHSRKFENLSLAPGETKWLAWDDFRFQTSTSPPSNFNLCIWTSHPNFRLDADPVNDGLCADFLVNDREPQVDFMFAVFPNPSSSGTMVECTLPVGHAARLRVFNSMGVLMAEYDAVENGGSLALPKFPGGLYFVSLEVEGAGARTLKLVQM